MSNEQAPVQPYVLGDLTPEEQAPLKEMRNSTNNLLMQLGRMAIDQQQMIRQVDHVQQQAQGVLNQIGARLKIPEGAQWQITATGQAIMAAPSPQPEAEVSQPPEPEPASES